MAFFHALVLVIKVVCAGIGIASELVQFNGKKKLICSASFYVAHRNIHALYSTKTTIVADLGTTQSPYLVKKCHLSLQ